MKYKYNELFARNELLLGKQAVDTISTKRVILFGVGGVGSWCAESLIRSGIQNLTLVDPDDVALSNINRQLPATVETIGQPKAEVLKARLLSINPDAKIEVIARIYSADTADSFRLESYDYIIDAIDSLKDKAHLLIAASKTEATVFSSMGAALKIDPEKIRVAEFWKVKGCKLASALRHRFRHGEKPRKKIMCVYSEERLENKGIDFFINSDAASSLNNKRANGTMVHITAIFGFTLAGLIIRDIVEKSE